MKTVVVTGATGLVGNAITRKLLERGDRVRVVTRDPVRAAQLLPRDVEVIRGDITDPSCLTGAFTGADAVFHAAGMPEQWVRDESVFDRVNREGTRNVCEAILKSGAGRLVYTSTMDVFEKDQHGLLTEERIDPNPKPTAYERSKQNAEKEVERFRSLGLDAVFLNPSAVYGPGPAVGTLNLLLQKLARGQVPMLPPGAFSVAWVDEVARAHLHAEKDGKSGERYLLADAHVTVREIAEVVARTLGKTSIPPAAPRWLLNCIAAVSQPWSQATGRPPLISKSELTFLYWNARVDARRSREVLGYTPMDFQEGVAKTLPLLLNRKDACEEPR